PGMPDPEGYEPRFLSGNAPADLQSETARLSSEWNLRKLNEIEAEQARDDLGRLSAEMMAIVARSARVADGHRDTVPDDVVEGGADRWVQETLDSGKRIMGFGHRIYRAEDPRSRLLKQTAIELDSPRVDVAVALERAALAALKERHPERELPTNVEFFSAVVLDVADVPPALAPAMFACSRVAGWSAHILEQKRTGRLFRPSARYIGPAPRSLNGDQAS